jgi:hypothetical protein
MGKLTISMAIFHGYVNDHPEKSSPAALLHFLGIEETAAMHSGCLVDQLQQRPWGCGWVLLGVVLRSCLNHNGTKGFYPLVNVYKKLWKDPPFLMETS